MPTAAALKPKMSGFVFVLFGKLRCLSSKDLKQGSPHRHTHKQMKMDLTIPEGLYPAMKENINGISPYTAWTESQGDAAL